MVPSTLNCKFGNFRENFIFANSVKRHICDVKYSRLEHHFTRSVNDRAITPFREGLIFTKLRICEVSRKLYFRKNFRIYSITFFKMSATLFLLFTAFDINATCLHLDNYQYLSSYPYQLFKFVSFKNCPGIGHKNMAPQPNLLTLGRALNRKKSHHSLLIEVQLQNVFSCIYC